MKWVAKRKANRQGNGKVRETRTQREKERKICKVKGKANRKVKLQQIGMKTKQKGIELKRK